MKKEYTKDIHAARLIKMLEKRWPNGELGCPAAPRYNPEKRAAALWDYNYDEPRTPNPCAVCQNFLRISLKCCDKCPCSRFKSCTEAAKQSWLRLEEEGYI